MLKILKEQEEIQFKEEDIIEGQNRGEIKVIDIEETIEFNRIIEKLAVVSIEACYVIKALRTNEREVVNGQLETIERATETIKDILDRYMPGLQESVNKSRERDTRAKVNTKQIIKEELKQAEYVEYDVIPLLRFREIQENLNLVIEGYFDIGENLTYEKTREIATDLTRIQNAIDNIATTISNELEGQLIYNNKGLEEGKRKSLKEGKRVNGSCDNGRKTYRK